MNIRTRESSAEVKSLNARPESATALSPSVLATLNGSAAENLNMTRPRTGASPVNNPAPVPAPNQIYRIGVGDVLDVRLADLPTSKSTLFTVLENGLLDYPLSNAPISVAGLTSDEIAEQLRSRIKVLDNPKVSVTVRDYSSHGVIVTGAVSDPGARFLRREATPLYVVLAEAGQRADSVQATITRSGSPVINIDLKNQSALGTLVMPGDVIKVIPAPAEPSTFFYAGGAINSPGQKAFHNGLTLTQAIIASGGVARATAYKVKLMRQGNDGRLATSEYNLRQIEEGKTPDPVVKEGDRINVIEGR
jgi:protein involved in polysaccharide export with SLBB domain